MRQTADLTENRSPAAETNCFGLRGLNFIAGMSAFAVLLCTSSQALAQAEPESPTAAPAPGSEAVAEPQAAPQESADSRPLPPPPPRSSANTGGTGYNPSTSYTPPTYYPPTPPDGVWRPFTFSVGLGPGFLALNNDKVKQADGGVAYSLRFGFGVQPNLSVTLGFEGASGYREGVTATQTALLLGVQFFATQLIYIRGGMGVANEEEVRDQLVIVDQQGFGFQGALGVDLIQAPNLSLSLEAGLLVGRYPGAIGSNGETWTSGGLNLVFNLY